MATRDTGKTKPIRPLRMGGQTCRLRPAQANCAERTQLGGFVRLSLRALCVSVVKIPQTKPIGAKRSRGQQPAFPLFSASFVFCGYHQFGFGRTSTRREPPGFPLREETPCGVTTNTAVPCQTKPIGHPAGTGSRAAWGPRALFATNEPNWEGGFRLEVGSGKKTRRTCGERGHSPYQGLSRQTKPIGASRP